MREYFRQEKISFRFMPVFYLTRLLFVALIILQPAVQLFIMMSAAMLSFGFRYEAEAEWLLPLTDEEIKRNKLIRCNFIWLRYFLTGAASIALAVFVPNPVVLRGRLFDRPLILAAFFVLQMLVTYGALLEKATEYGREKKKKGFFRLFSEWVPTAVCFIYGFAGLAFRKREPFFMSGGSWLHAGILLACAAIYLIRCMKLYNSWSIKGFRVEQKKEEKQEVRT